MQILNITLTGDSRLDALIENNLRLNKALYNKQKEIEDKTDEFNYLTGVYAKWEADLNKRESQYWERRNSLEKHWRNVRTKESELNYLLHAEKKKKG